MAKKPVNFRIDEDILAEFDKLTGSRTENLENAMKAYIGIKTDVNQGKEDVKADVKERKGDVNTGVNTDVKTDVNQSEERSKGDVNTGVKTDVKADVNQSEERSKGYVNTGVNTGVNTDVNTDMNMYVKTIEILEDDKSFLQKQVEELQNANAEMRRLLLVEQQKSHMLPGPEEKHKAFWKRLLFWKK